MARNVIRFADWCDQERYHGFKPPRRSEPWDAWIKIYLLSAGDFIKIGVTNDVVRRTKTLQAGCPFPIVALSIRSVPTVVAFQVERRVHAALKPHQAHGEWFRADAAEAKRLVHIEIVKAKSAMEKWVRDGFMDWTP